MLHIETREVFFTNIGDTPTDKYALCYPTDSNPHRGAEHYSRIVYSEYIDKCHKLSIMEAREQASKKSGLSTLELDIRINDLIESHFRALLEEETDLTWETIYSTNVEDLALMKPELSTINDYIQVKTKPENLSSETLYKNSRFAVNNFRVNHNSMYSL